MPSSDSNPPAPGARALGEWLVLLGSRQPPVDPLARDAALEELAQNRGNAASLAQHLLSDPALVLLLFRAANRALARYDRSVHTLEHAISLLGAKRIQKLLNDAVPLDPAHPYADDYRHALLRSEHAAWQARLWAEGSGRWQPEDVFWSTLLAAAPLWLLWLEAGPALRDLEMLRARQGAISSAQQIRHIGCPLPDLAMALGEYWLLPESGRLSWHKATAGSPRQWLRLANSARLDAPPELSEGGLSERSFHPALAIAVANQLAQETDWDWYSKRSARLLRIAASACRRPLSTLLSYSHRTAAEMSRGRGETGLLTPAARLLCRWRHADLLAPPPPPLRQAAPEMASVSNAELVTRTLQRLREPGTLGNPRAAFDLALKAMREGIGLERAAVFLLGSGGELRLSLADGIAVADPLRQFRATPAPGTLLGQLLAKPGCLSLDADNRDRVWPHLPEAFRSDADSDGFLLMSVFAGKRPLALVYADNRNRRQAPGANQQLLFRRLCQQLSLCLDQLSGRASRPR